MKKSFQNPRDEVGTIEGASIARKRGTKKIDTLPSSMRERLLEFKAYLQLELGRSKNTILSYIEDMCFFGEFLAKTKGASKFEEADSDSAVEWSSTLTDTKASSQARRLSSLKCFGLYMLEEGLWTRNFADSASRPRLRRNVPQVLNSREIDDIIEKSAGDKFERVRDGAMLEMMYGSGLRVSELCSLKDSDLDLSTRIARIRGKGAKTRLVPIGTLAVEAILRYKSERAKLKKNSVAELFITRRGSKLSRKTFWYNLKKYATLADIKKPVKPHGLRHSFATHLLQNGANLMSIKEMLGHSDLSTTQIYTQLVDDDIRREYAQKSPRSKMKVVRD